MTAKRFKIVAIEEELYPMPVYYDNHKKKELEYNEVCDLLNELAEENEQIKSLNIPIEEIKETVVDYKRRIVGVYYND